MKEDGLVSSYEEYMALDERIVDDWRLYSDARTKLAERLNASKARR